MAELLRSFLSVPPQSSALSHTSANSSPSRPKSESSPDSSDGGTTPRPPPKKIPKGVVLGADGKPCRSCTSFASWAAASSSSKPSPVSGSSDSSSSSPPTSTSSPEIPQDCPADVEVLGRSTWTFLHTMTATYPAEASAAKQLQTKQFLGLFGEMYPCAPCAADFREWMAEEGNEPQVAKREDFGRWMCRAHNAVNVKLGKDEFDCRLWDKRWRTGDWGDGRCG